MIALWQKWGPRILSACVVIGAFATGFSILWWCS